MLAGVYRAATSPAWLAYLAVVRARRWMYRRGVARAWNPPRPTLSVGNLLAGGTGKTPLVRWMCGELLKEGLAPAVLMRGYGSGRKAPLLLNVGAPAPPGAGGDEAALLAHALPAVPIVVCPSRRRGAEALLARRNVDVFVLDDGFQHLAVARDCDVVVIDVSRSHAASRLLPWGTLREPLPALLDAHVICATHGPEGEPLPRWLLATAHRFGIEIARARHRPTNPVRLADRAPLPAPPPDVPWLLLAGVGHPRALVQSLERAGHRFERCFFFPDHHAFTWGELAAIIAADPSACWMTTAKDAVRLAPMLEAANPTSRFLAERSYVVDVELEIIEGADALRGRMLAAVQG